jgi:hypothetical protein
MNSTAVCCVRSSNNETCKQWTQSGRNFLSVGEFFRLRNVNIVGFYYLFNCYMFWSYYRLQADMYLLELTLLTADPLSVE